MHGGARDGTRRVKAPSCLIGVLPELIPLVPQRLRPQGELLHAGVGGGETPGDGGAAVLEPGDALLQPFEAVPQALEALLEAGAQVVVLVEGHGEGDWCW